MSRAGGNSFLNRVLSSRGLYSRVARKMKCDPSYVSRIARGERHSQRITAALAEEAMRVYKGIAKAARVSGRRKPTRN